MVFRRFFIANNDPNSQGGFLGDNWDDARDEDWFGVDLTAGYEYTVSLWTPTSIDVEHQATQLKILGLHDHAGTFIAGTASSDAGVSVSVTFQIGSTGRYYIAVGSQGDDQTGVYSVSVAARRLIE